MLLSPFLGPTAAQAIIDVSQWLHEEIAQLDAMTFVETPVVSIWEVSREGKPAYFFVAACCDRNNLLFDAGGQYICSPSGGHTGWGDGKCATPMDRETYAKFMWAHPLHPERDEIPEIPPANSFRMNAMCLISLKCQPNKRLVPTPTGEAPVLSARL
jgi:hypothetical protein